MPSGESSSGSAKSDPPTMDPNAFEKEMMGLTGGFPGGEVGLKDFVAKNPPPPPKRAQTDGKESSAVDGISREIKALPLCFAIYTDKPEVACVEHSGVGHTRNPGAPDLITRWVAKREQPISGEPQHRTGWHLNRRLLTVGAALGVPNDSLFRDLVELDGKEVSVLTVKLEARQSRKKAGHRPNSVMRTGTVG
ncbi:hypothetical protein ZWY2020_012503 [Hordeum vulgare]|nr:hypothetical protein ZWY2020_012503 [Hordeum vulgare]